jgi:competence CoiA-like predicted nuclease
MYKCNTNYQSQYAQLNGNKICADDIINGIYPTSSIFYCCNHEHELIFVNCTKRRSHFRHRHSADLEGTPMTDWHSEWQSNFPITEIKFPSINSQYHDRRADIVISEYKNIIEIQHSKIESREITERIHDYKLHGYTVIWIIDAQESIERKRIGERSILHFIKNTWLYEHFRISNTIVYYDIGGFIYKVNPNLVRSHQLDVSEPKPKSEFIEALKNNKDLWESDEPPQCFLYLKQQGAGSGKTYGMIQLLNNDIEIAHFRFITLITKQHAAVNVMFTEFINQYRAGILTNIELKGEPEISNKKYIVHYTHKLTNIEVYAIFATVDSFTYALGESPKNAHDQFVGIVKSIVEGNIRTTSTGTMTYAGVNPVINKEMLIMIDETQDLTELYGEAFLQIVRSKSTNLCVVGDRLQSLSYQENALTFLHKAEAAHMKVIKSDVKNVVRRFSDPTLVNFVNSVIPFTSYDLPIMIPALTTAPVKDSLTVFRAKTVYATESAGSNKVIDAVNQIMEYFKAEVETNSRLPEDFMIVTPFTGQNPLIKALQMELNIYWKNIMETNSSYIEHVKSNNFYWKDINTNEYIRYAIFHRAEEGGSINLSDSEHATRIVSIHSSKGDGRKVVFVIGVTQSALQKFSQVANNLIYDSLFHVAITRQKEKLFFRLEANNDDIHSRISKCVAILATSNDSFEILKDKIKLQNISSMLHLSFDELSEKIICNMSIPDITESKEDRRLIDMGDHNIRYASMFMNIMVHSCNHELKIKSDIKKQFAVILSNLKNIKSVSQVSDYIKILHDNNEKKGYVKILHDNNEKKGYEKIIPIIKYHSKPSDIDYGRYYLIILETMNRIISELNSVYKAPINYFCPFECVILYYMIECVENGTYQAITIDDVYNIINIYSKSFDNSSLGHEYCKCKKHFTESKTDLNSIQLKYQEYLRNHYDNLMNINSMLDNFDKTHSQVNWLYNHYIELDITSNKDFKIYKRYAMIGYDNKAVYIFNIKPQFNTLNKNNFLTDSILDTYLLLNVNKETENFKRFNNKMILSCVVSLNKNDIYVINWTSIIQDKQRFLKDKLYNILYNIFNEKHVEYYNLFKHTIDKDLSKSPLKILETYITKIKDNLSYASKAFEYIKMDTERAKNKKKILEKYANKDAFILNLNDRLKSSLITYLGLSDEDDDEEDDTTMIS